MKPRLKLNCTYFRLKIFEAKDAISRGAQEIDMVLNIGAIKEGNYELVKNDIKAVHDACNGTLLKVIFETCLLEKLEIVKACEICKEVGVEYVKTSTGFGTGGATVEHIRLMRETVGPDMGVKASGGVRNLTDAQAMIEAGATRIGASSGVQIMKELETGVTNTENSGGMY